MTNDRRQICQTLICHLLSVICHPDELQASTGSSTASHITKRSMNPSTGVSRSREASAKRDRIRLEFFSEILLRKLFSNFSNSSGSPSFLRRGMPMGYSTTTFLVVGSSLKKN